MKAVLWAVKKAEQSVDHLVERSVDLKVADSAVLWAERKVVWKAGKMVDPKAARTVDKSVALSGVWRADW